MGVYEILAFLVAIMLFIMMYHLYKAVIVDSKKHIDELLKK